MSNNENLHIAARTAMHHAAVVLTNLADIRRPKLDAEDMALLQARLSDLNRAFVETGLLPAPAQGELSALPRTWQERSAELIEPPSGEQAYALLQGEINELRAFIRGQQGGGDAARQLTDADIVRIEVIEQFVVAAKARGFAWDSMAFDTNKTAREQLDARISATKQVKA